MRTRKIVIIGAYGQLGTDLVNKLREKKVINAKQEVDLQIISLTHSQLELCNDAEVREILTFLEPDVVINTAGYHRVDECEAYPEKAFQVNAFALRSLACVCRDLDTVLVHISTNYVFGGEQNRWLPYTENDLPRPVNVYGTSKLAGEKFVQNICPKYFIVRSSGLYGLAGSSGKGGNFVELMLRLAREGELIQVVNDQWLTPTYTVDLAQKIADLIINEQYGIYHITNAGNCSWYEFAGKIFEYTNVVPKLSPISTAAFGARAKRPRYAVLSCQQSLEKMGSQTLQNWQDALKTYIRARADS
jgi:dTDP-4-dehydrorhamnose reductase